MFFLLMKHENKLDASGKCKVCKWAKIKLLQYVCLRFLGYHTHLQLKSREIPHFICFVVRKLLSNNVKGSIGKTCLQEFNTSRCFGGSKVTWGT